MEQSDNPIIGLWRQLRAARRPAPMTVEEYFQKLLSKGLHPDGTPILDPTPMAPPIGYKRHPSMVEIVRDMVQSERLRQEAMEAGHETFEESEDFEIDDDPLPLQSPWENQHDPSLEELLAAGREAMAAKQAAGESGGVQGGTPPAGATPEASARPNAKRKAAPEPVDPPSEP